MSITLLIAVIVTAIAGSTFAGEDRDIALSEVPAAVLTAAEVAAEGITLQKAEVEETDDGLVYELKGMKGEEELELYIAADGKVLKIEKDSDDDDSSDESDDDSSKKN